MRLLIALSGVAVVFVISPAARHTAQVLTRLLGILLLVACSSYQSGEVFRLTSVEGGRRFECLDLQVTPSFDRGRSWIPIQFAMGNHCRHAVRVDLSAVQVRVTHGENEMPLIAYDPRDEIQPAQLDGRREAEETIAYELPLSWVGKRLQVCVRLNLVAESIDDPSAYCFDWEAT